MCIAGLTWKLTWIKICWLPVALPWRGWNPDCLQHCQEIVFPFQTGSSYWQFSAPCLVQSSSSPPALCQSSHTSELVLWLLGHIQSSLLCFFLRYPPPCRPSRLVCSEWRRNPSRATTWRNPMPAPPLLQALSSTSSFPGCHGPKPKAAWDTSPTWSWTPRTAGGPLFQMGSTGWVSDLSCFSLEWRLANANVNWKSDDRAGQLGWSGGIKTMRSVCDPAALHCRL